MARRGRAPGLTPSVPDKAQRDEPVKIPLDPEEAIRAILHVDPESEPVDDEDQPPVSGR